MSGRYGIRHIVAVVIFVLGMSALGYLIFHGLTNYNVEYQRITAPGQHELKLDKVGKYTIFYEYYSVLNGKEYNNSSSNPDLLYAVTDLSTGKQIKLTAPEGASTYESDEHEGRSILEFDVAKPGKYEIAARYEDVEEGPELVLAVGQDFILQIILCFLGGITLLTFTVGGAFWIWPPSEGGIPKQTAESFRTRNMGPYIE
ncbi:MAG: hypothetical protein ACM3UZ_16950 [Acidobacteriota bacterium]